MLNKFFKLDENNTDLKTELLAGLTTFLAMAYILGVNRLQQEYFSQLLLLQGSLVSSWVLFQNILLVLLLVWV